MTTNQICFASVLLAVTLFWGCEGTEIEKVKNGTFQGYQQTTIGKAVESVLAGAEWEYFETDKGVRVVEVQGEPGTKTIERFVYGNFNFDMEKYNYNDILSLGNRCEDIPNVKIQFTLFENSDSFEVSYCGIGEKNLSCNELIAHIYDNDVHYESAKKRCERFDSVKSDVLRKQAEILKKFGSFTDSRDGKVYKTIKIGQQLWMAENLDFDYIVEGSPYGTNSGCKNCGKYYTWAAAIDSAGVWSKNGINCGDRVTCIPKYPVRGICPEGWHLPSIEEMREIISVLKEKNISILDLMSFDDYMWERMPEIANAEFTGFSVILAGSSFRGRTFGNYGESASFWSATENNEGEAFRWYLDVRTLALGLNDKDFGFSVRCIKD